MSGAGLACAFAAHTDGAFEEAYRRYAKLLRAAARQVLGAGDEAPDVVHDALLRVWSRATYRVERGTLPAFLVVCVRNEAISRRRSDARYATLARRVATAPLDGVEQAESIAIRTALAGLPRQQRDVIELFYWGRYTQTEIAAKLQVPLGTVKSRASLGLRKLTRTLGQGERNDREAPHPAALPV